jgi:hypothetical protein
VFVEEMIVISGSKLDSVDRGTIAWGAFEPVTFNGAVVVFLHHQAWL